MEATSQATLADISKVATFHYFPLLMFDINNTTFKLVFDSSKP